jgi:hypothetical protein
MAVLSPGCSQVLWAPSFSQSHCYLTLQGSQYRVGEAYYRGDSEWPQDGEEALIWLNRAAKYVNGDKAISGAAGVRTPFISCTE